MDISIASTSSLQINYNTILLKVCSKFVHRLFMNTEFCYKPLYEVAAIDEPIASTTLDPNLLFTSLKS